MIRISKERICMNDQKLNLYVNIDTDKLRERLKIIMAQSPEPLYKLTKRIGLAHKTVIDFLEQRRNVYWGTIFKIRDFVEREEKKLG